MLNEISIDQLREWVKDGLEKSAADGNYYGGSAPLGYKYEFYFTKQEQLNKVLQAQKEEKHYSRSKRARRI